MIRLEFSVISQRWDCFTRRLSLNRETKKKLSIYMYNVYGYLYYAIVMFMWIDFFPSASKLYTYLILLLSSGGLFWITYIYILYYMCVSVCIINMRLSNGHHRDICSFCFQIYFDDDGLNELSFVFFFCFWTLQ